MDSQRFKQEILNALAEDHAMVNFPEPRTESARDSFEYWKREFSSNTRIIEDLGRLHEALGGDKISERDLEVCKRAYVAGYKIYMQQRAMDDDDSVFP